MRRSPTLAGRLARTVLGLFLLATSLLLLERLAFPRGTFVVPARVEDPHPYGG